MNAPRPHVPPLVERLPDGRVQVRTGKVEIGQGIHHVLAQIVADGLSLPMSQIEVLPVDTDHSPDQGVTSGSRSVQDAGPGLREACTALQAPGALSRWVGRSVPRPHLAAVFAGQPVFIPDLVLPGMRHGRVLHPPLGAQRAGTPLAAPGVIHDGRLSGVLADSSAEADAALRRLDASLCWDTPALPPEEADDLQALPAQTRTVCDQAAAPGTPPVARRVRGRYTKPWIAHASIAPSCALAQWLPDGRLHVWTHSQGIFNLRHDLSKAFGLAETAVRVTHVPGAGCYGHNGADDVAFDAAWLARHAEGRPVRVQWTRADELSHAPFGPAMVVEIDAGLDADGRIVEWRHDTWSPGHSRRPGRAPTPALLGAWQIEAAAPELPSIDMPLSSGGGAERNAIPTYAIPAQHVRCHRMATRRRSSALRALGALANVFAAESLIDEVAHATGADPLVLRKSLLQKDLRALAVLDAVAERAGWHGRARAEGRGQGLGFARYKGNGAWCAVLADVTAGERLRVNRLTIAVDVGQAINPDGVVQQIEGGAIQATSWALVEAARPAHAGWDEYPILRSSDVPQVDVIVIPSDQPWLGAGEASLGPTAAAIANALFDALGVRVRDLPLTPERIIAAMGDASSP